MRYPIVLLDVGGTLVGPRQSFGTIYARVLGELGVERPAHVFDRSLKETMEEMERRVPAGRDRYRQFPGGEVGYWQEFARVAIGKAVRGGDGGAPPGVDDDVARQALARLRETFRRREAWEIFADVVPALERLRDSGVRLGVVSNWDSRLPQLLRMLDLADYFETVTVSHLEGIEKPDPSIFERTLERMGADPEQALYVGDRPEIDLEGARAAGLDAVMVDRQGRLGPGFATVRDLGALPEIARSGLRTPPAAPGP